MSIILKRKDSFQEREREKKKKKKKKEKRTRYNEKKGDCLHICMIF